MYHAINSSIDQLLSRSEMRKLVADYAWLTCRFAAGGDVTTDVRFQDKYKSFWALNAARLDDSFLKPYFGLLQSLRGIEMETEGILKKVTAELREIPKRSGASPANQFSFASKLVHALDASSPVFDSRVRAFFSSQTRRRQTDSSPYTVS